MNRGKVVIIGAGCVGTSIAYSIVNQGLCEEIVIIDMNNDKAEGEALDISHAMEFVNRKTYVHAGNYDECGDADVAIICASAPMAKGINDRMYLLNKNKEIIKSVVNEIMFNSFNGILIVVSNPVDVMTYVAWKQSGLPSCQVIGSGTTLDTARLHYNIAKKIDIDPKNVNAYIIGEHGDSEMVAWSTASIGGKDISSVFEDNIDRIGPDPYNDFLKETIDAGWEIMSRKGNTSYGIASSVTGILKSILFDENAIYPVSVYLEDYYGQSDVYISLPTIINSNGAKEIVNIKLTDEEQVKFIKSCCLLKEKCKNC